MDIINEIHYCRDCGFSHNFTHGKSPEAIRLDLEDGKDAWDITGRTNHFTARYTFSRCSTKIQCRECGGIRMSNKGHGIINYECPCKK
jgi:hypothetical protein